MKKISLTKLKLNKRIISSVSQGNIKGGAIPKSTKRKWCTKIPDNG